MSIISAIHDTDHSNICVKSGPGSGKTRLIVERAKFLASRNLSFKVLSFTTSVIQELRSRFSAALLPIDSISTFHSCALKVLPTQLHIDAKIFETFFSGSQNAYARQIISRWRSSGYTVSQLETVMQMELPLIHELSSFSPQIVKQWREYENFCLEKNTWDFTHLLEKSIPFLVKPIFDHVLVDEYQDMSYLQWQLVLRLAKNIFLVGDESQAIFSFQTGNPVSLPDTFHIYEMRENWRCPPQICLVANQLIGFESTISVCPPGPPVDFSVYQTSVDEFREMTAAAKSLADLTIDDGNITRKITIAILFRSKFFRDKWITEFRDCPENVSLLTIYAAKGRQFDFVCVPICIDKEYPHYNSEDIEEERRTLYVAMTRSRRWLHLSYARYYADLPATLSRFLRFLKDVALHVEDFSSEISIREIEQPVFQLVSNQWISAQDMAHRFSLSPQRVRKILQNQYTNPDKPCFRGKIITVMKHPETGHYMVDAFTLPNMGLEPSPQVVMVDPTAVQKYPFVDWLTFSQFSKDSISQLNGGRIVKYNAENGVEYTVRSGIPYTGSFDTSVYLRAYSQELYHRLVGSGNFGRLHRPDNLWNFGFFETVQRANTVLKVFHLPPMKVQGVTISQFEKVKTFTRMEVEQKKHSIYAKRFQDNPKVSVRYVQKRFGSVEVVTVTTVTDGARLSRIDLTKNFSVGSEENLKTLIYTLNSLNPTRMRKRSYGPDVIFPQSVIWGEKSKLFNLEVYDKGAEILEHAKTDYQRDLGRYCRSQGFIRVELKLRGLLVSRGLSYLAFVTEQKLSQIFDEKTKFLGDKFGLDGIYADLVAAVNRKECGKATLNTYLLWKSGVIVKDMMAVRTLQTHQAKIKEITGISAFSLREMPLDVAHLAKTYDIEIRPVAAPPEYRSSYLSNDDFSEVVQQVKVA